MALRFLLDHPSKNDIPNAIIKIIVLKNLLVKKCLLAALKKRLLNILFGMQPLSRFLLNARLDLKPLVLLETFYLLKEAKIVIVFTKKNIIFT